MKESIFTKANKQKGRVIREADFPDLPMLHLLYLSVPRISVLWFLSCIFFPSYHVYWKLGKVELFPDRSSPSKTHSKCVCVYPGESCYESTRLCTAAFKTNVKLKCVCVFARTHVSVSHLQSRVCQPKEEYERAGKGLEVQAKKETSLPFWVLNKYFSDF